MSEDQQPTRTVAHIVTADAGRHARDLEPGEHSPVAEAFRIAARGVRAQADRDWVARRLGRAAS